MSDIKETMKNWETAQKSKQQQALKFMVELIKQFDARYYGAEYSGEGDSGSINFTCLSKEPLNPDGNLDCWGGNFLETSDAILKELQEAACLTCEVFPADIRPYQYPGTEKRRTYTVFDALEHCAYYLLPSGFEINDGGQGVLILDAETGEVQLETGTNYTEVNYNSISIQLEE